MRHVDIIRQRLAREQGTLRGQGRRAVALVYPSPYPVGMASLGFQTVYRCLNALDDTVCERAFLPDDEALSGSLLTYESERPVSDFPVVAFSVAYELEISGLFRCLSLMGVPLLSAERSDRDPLIVVGGPLTFSNPVPVAPFADVIVMGEGEALLEPLLQSAFDVGPRHRVLEVLAELPGFYVPAHHGEVPGAVAQCPDELLPAASAIMTPDSALSDMFLIEVERGCSRGCSFCVMRRTTNGGMRLVEPQRILAAIPEAARRVGLVGAAVSDHPRIVDIVRAIVDAEREVGLSSLRSDRLTEEFVEVLVRGGYRTLTVASDGASEALRRGLLKRIREKHLLRAAQLAADARMKQLKVYMMVGVPGETDADIDELIAFSREQAHVCGTRTRLSLGIAPFVAKRNTPMDGEPFAGVREVERRIKKIRRSLAPLVEVRPASARWAWVEYVLAQGAAEAGLAALRAHERGGRYADYRRELADVPVGPAPTGGEHASVRGVAS